jgi:Cu/Zn superoxide dismutase
VLFATLSVTVSGCGGSDEENRLAGEEALTLRLGEQNQSGQAGTATFTSLDGGRMRIVIELSRPPSVPQPAHIHRGSCDNLGLPVVALQSLEDGRSVTEAEITLEKLERRHLVIHAHKSEAEYDVSVACAAIAGLG